MRKTLVQRAAEHDARKVQKECDIVTENPETLSHDRCRTCPLVELFRYHLVGCVHDTIVVENLNLKGSFAKRKRETNTRSEQVLSDGGYGDVC